MAGPPPRRPTWCPWCNAQGARQPILSELLVIDRKTVDGVPRWLYACQKCGYEEYHDERID